MVANGVIIANFTDNGCHGSNSKRKELEFRFGMAAGSLIIMILD